MAEYVYPALFHSNEDGSFTIEFPDLPGCISEGKSLSNAMHMAQEALAQWLDYSLEKAYPLPTASSLPDVKCAGGEFASLICTTVRDSRAVRRTVSIPKWMDDKVTEAGLSLSRVLQDALKDRLP